MEYGEEITFEALTRIPRLKVRATVKMLPSICKRVLDADLFRRYVATALYAAGNNQRMTVEYNKLISREKPDTRTPEQIKNDIIEKAGLILNEPV